MEDYANRNGFRNIVHFTDDGVSVTRFDRSSFVKMMDEVAAGNVGTVITKDLSRFGRKRWYWESFSHFPIALLSLRQFVS